MKTKSKSAASKMINIIMYRFQHLILIIITVMSFGCSQGEKMTDGKRKNETIMISRKQQPPRPPDAVKAPDFLLSTTDGISITMNNLLGKVILLTFWGTWCAPCRMEIPDLINLHEKYNGDGLEVVGVTISSGSMENISDFVERWKINYLVLTDIGNDETLMLTDEYSRVTGRPITGVPSTFIIDRDGYIVKSYIGPRSERVFYNDLKPYL